MVFVELVVVGALFFVAFDYTLKLVLDFFLWLPRQMKLLFYWEDATLMTSCCLFC